MGNIGEKARRKSSSAFGHERVLKKSHSVTDMPRSGTVLDASESGGRLSDPGPSYDYQQDENDENFDHGNTANERDEDGAGINAALASTKSPRLKGDPKRDLGSWKKVRNHKTMAERKRRLRSRTPQSIRVAAHMTLRGSVQEIDRVALPPGENLNEWLAFHTLHFFEAAILMNGTLQESCTKESCPEMNAGPKYKYLWADGSRIKSPIDVSAPEYISYMFAWIDEQVNDPKIFPEDEDVKFPRNFKAVVRKIFSRLFRLYAHIYRNHMKDITAVGAEAHLNSCFKHFIQFVKEFKLLQDKEMKPLASVMRTLEQQAQERKENQERMDREAAAAQQEKENESGHVPLGDHIYVEPTGDTS